jgi:hypothetical protein
MRTSCSGTTLPLNQATRSFTNVLMRAASSVSMTDVTPRYAARPVGLLATPQA